jgi:regulator of RNase E activity RraB
MTAREQDFDVYMVTIDDRPASIIVDLAAAAYAPLESHPLRVDIQIPMRIPTDDGLRDASELEALSDLEDQFVEALEQKVDAIYVGHVVHDGNTNLHFYVPDSHRAAVDDLPSLTGEPGAYEPSWGVEEDPDWQLFDEFLAPGPYEAQEIWNRRLMETFREGGDRLESERTIDHLAVFASRDSAEQAASALREVGFATDDVEGPDEEGVWRLPFHRADHLAEGRPDEFCEQILDLILEHDGHYDGWGAPMVK